MRKSWILLALLLLGLVLLVISSPASAQISQLDNLTAQFAKKLKKEKPIFVAVADFTAVDGSASEPGANLASAVSYLLVTHETKLRVLEHKSFREFVEQQISHRRLICFPELRCGGADRHCSTRAF